MNDFWLSITTIATALVTVAIIGELVSKNAQTPQVIGAATSGFGQDLAVAVSPVTGSGNVSLSVGGLSEEY